MNGLNEILGFPLPLQNPVLKFALILFIILFAPILLNKIKIPQLIGLILAGAVVGPNGLNLLLRDSSVILFGTVGLLYIMFLAGLEIDFADFKKNSGRSMVFGLYTFVVPMVVGTLVGLYVLNFSIPTSVLLASMFASHTLIAYPIISQFGVIKNRAVSIAIGGTLVTDTLALLVLAIIVGITTGSIDSQFWVRLGISFTAFVLAVVIGFPLIARWFFKRFDDAVSQYIFVLAMVFLAAFLAEAAGVEAIIGAFLGGLTLNRLIPSTSPLMNRIDFVGRALFIPFFLIGVGMLIDFRAFVKDWQTVKVAVVMTVTATSVKFIAAWLSQKTFGLSLDERRLVFGLSNAQAAATLAAVLIGYNIVMGYDAEGNPLRLLDDSILNGTVLMILVTCTIATFVAQKGAQNIALSGEDEEHGEEGKVGGGILIPLNGHEDAEELVNLSVTMHSKKGGNGLYALSVVVGNEESSHLEAKFRKALERAEVAASATDNLLQPLLRYDLNVAIGIANVVKERKISDVLLFSNPRRRVQDAFFWELIEGPLARGGATTLVYRPFQPMVTVKRYIVVVPPNAEKEIGFMLWLVRIWNIGRNTGSKLIFYGAQQTLDHLRDLQGRHPVEAVFQEFTDWTDFLILSREVRRDDCLVIVLSKRGFPSFQLGMTKVPAYLDKYFGGHNVLLVNPVQEGIVHEGGAGLPNPSMIDPFKGNLDKLERIRKSLGDLFGSK